MPVEPHRKAKALALYQTGMEIAEIVKAAGVSQASISRWVAASGLNKRFGRAMRAAANRKLSPEQLAAVRKEHSGGLGYKTLAKKYGVTPTTIRRLLNARI